MENGGYINPNGDVVIDFKFDYASPFVNINLFNKNFKVALVCDKKSTKIILKNERKVMSYKTESRADDYDAKYNEFYDIYKNKFGQDGEMEYEIKPVYDYYINKRPVYEENTDNYTYRYDYNEEYDVIITEGYNQNKYELALKDNLNNRKTLYCDNLAYDSKYLYIYNNGYIPFYNPSSKEQGWFDQKGNKTTMAGNVQIIDFFDDRILIKNYNTNKLYFIDTTGSNIISPSYSELMCCGDIYIVKNDNGKYIFINKDYEKVYEDEFDYVDTSFYDRNVFMCVNLGDNIETDNQGYVKIMYYVISLDGRFLGQYTQVLNPKHKEYFDNIKLKNKYIGDDFYK